MNSKQVTSGKFLWNLTDIRRECDLDSKTVRVILRTAAAEFFKIMQEQQQTE